MKAGSHRLEPHGGQLLELRPRVGRQVQDALPVLVAGVGGIGEVFRALQDGFQRRGEILLGLKVQILPKSFDIHLRTKATSTTRQYSHLTEMDCGL